MREHVHPGGADLSGPDPMAIVSPEDLRLLVSDFESLVAAGVIRGTRQEAAEFFSGWLGFGTQRGPAGVSEPLSLCASEPPPHF